MSLILLKKVSQFLWLHKRTVAWTIIVLLLALYVLFLKACQPDIGEVMSEKDKLYQDQIDALVDNHRQDLIAREAEMNKLLSDLANINKKYQTARDELSKTRNDRVENDSSKDPKELTARLARDFGLMNLDP